LRGDTIMLSDKAREAIGLQQPKVVFGDIRRTITVNARSNSLGRPSHDHVAGACKIDRYWSGREVVAPGQELAAA